MGLEIKFYIYISTACHLIHFGGRVLLSDLRKVRDVGDGWADQLTLHQPKGVDCAPPHCYLPTHL